MDLSPEALQSVKFRGAVRGYHTGEVDEFIEKVAAGVRELLDQLRKANERAAKAESGPPGDARPSDDAVRRTLMHAQKLADAVISEARQEAVKVGQEAEEQARRLRTKTRDEAQAHIAKTQAARAEAERLLAEAESDRAKARAEVDALLERAAADVDKDLMQELDRLARVRTTLQRDCEALERWLEDQRQSLRMLLADALSVIDQSALPIAQPPAIAEVETHIRLPGTDRPARASDRQPSAPEAPASEPSAPEPPAQVKTTADPEPETAVEESVWAAPGTPAAAAAPPAPVASPQAAKPPKSAEPATPAAPGTKKPRDSKKSADEMSDDDFLAELKRAAESTEPLGESQR
jgi:DivIVA domain-containing protein